MAALSGFDLCSMAAFEALRQSDESYEYVFDTAGLLDGVLGNESAVVDYLATVVSRLHPAGVLVVSTLSRVGGSGAPRCAAFLSDRGWRVDACKADGDARDVVTFVRAAGFTVPVYDDDDESDDGLPKWIAGDSLAPFVGTPAEYLAEIFAFANLSPSDVVVDVGSGDGRIPISAVAEFGCKSAFGIELESKLVSTARSHALNRGVAHRVRFVQGDCLDASAKDVQGALEEATLLIMYLLPEALAAVRPLIQSHLLRGRRLLTIGWAPKGIVPARTFCCGQQTGCGCDAFLFQSEAAEMA